ncbi:FAD-linked oxidase [Nocardioides psychrotolerans]|uniref:Glycolate oxidase n=1 Tax=Nocardioides psychrotolerans TaxID=1005945 RepID=A0A1I3NBS5_9ACTN|nr:FAD-linked oxidase C-terminal domain-containing protein [Nocardioides psychrotolerans]GEP39835.1 FAD-linked oxidase [Nocardioides psychrotolerans]SFJ06615.1 glycolate oxidase [Nocardioides psychrotolerans]
MYDDPIAAAFGDLAADLFTTDPDLVAGFAHDESRLTERALPAGVLSPRSTHDVADMARRAHAHGVPLVARGAGSGLSGAANAPAGSVVLRTHRLAAILEVDAAERLAVVQPGVVTADLRAVAREAGLFYPPDPGSVAISTVGGNVATDAGGMCCVKYGVTGDYVLGLEVVLADGTVVRTGRRTAKGVAGYDLTSLFVGSEGTLGIITEITVRLLPAPAAAAQTLVATFPDLASAGRVVAAIAASGTAVSMLEIMDRVTLRAVDARTGMGFDPDTAAMVLAQADDQAAATTVAALALLCADGGATDVATSEDPDEAELLLEARRQALPALEALGDWLLDDVCVPRTRIVDLLEGVEAIAAAASLTIGVFGHAGDGNMHPTVIYDQSDPASRAAASRAFDAITRLALDLGGTITGEHGVGRLKTSWLAHELDPAALALQRRIKDALDPTGILNPGAVLAAD